MSVFRKQTSRKGSVVYEEVLQKNFEIIETFLKKFHQIFTKQDQFEQHLNKFAERFTEYDEFFDEFRQEQRLSIVMLEKKSVRVIEPPIDSVKSTFQYLRLYKLPRAQKVHVLTYEDYTLLKFDSIQNQNQEVEDVKFLRKQSEESGLSTKQYEEMKESIESVKEELDQMKDKISFLSAYTSSISNQQGGKSKIESIKKQLMESLDQETKSKVQKQIRMQMMETQKVFIQQINNLAIRFSDELTESVDKKYEKISADIAKLDGLLFTNNDADKLRQDIKKEMKTFASECLLLFPDKQQTNKSLNFIERKVRNLEKSFKESFNNLQDKNQQDEYLKSLLQVNIKNNSRSSSLHKQNKSQSHFIKQKNHSSSITLDLDDQAKQNTARKTGRHVDDLTKGNFFTSKASKQFMKNFGVKQRKLIKTNFQVKKEFDKTDKSSPNAQFIRPQTALLQNHSST